MHVQVHYQNLEHTPWVDQFIERRIAKLNRYLGESASIHVNVKYIERDRHYVTSLAIHHPYHDYAFTTEGLNLYESFSSAIDKAARTLAEQKKKIKDKIKKKFFSIKEMTVES